jgi:hypothetical protein
MSTESAILEILRELGAPAITTLVFMAALIFVIGFCLRGISFVRYGFGRTIPESSLEKHLDDLAAKVATKEDLGKMATATKEDMTKMAAATKEDLGKMATKEDMDGIRTEVKTEIQTIKVNDFGHLKNFLTELTSILLDKGIINNENKARLDNQLRDM